MNFNQLNKASCSCVHFLELSSQNLLFDKFSPNSSLLVKSSLLEVSSEMDVILKVSSALRFPDYFSPNWDAVDECLISLNDWLPANGYVLAFTEASFAWGKTTLALGKLISVWQDAAHEWSKVNKPFHLLFIL